MNFIKMGEIGEILKSDDDENWYFERTTDLEHDEDVTDLEHECSCKSARGCKECLMTEW